MKMVNTQKGAVLIVSLVLLIIMTLLGLSSMSNTVMEERMAGNQRNSNLAFQAAESALRSGEDAIFDWPTSIEPPPGTASGDGDPTDTGTSDTNKGVYILNSPDPDGSNNMEWWQERDNSWWVANATAYDNQLEFISGEFLSDPRYILEKISSSSVDDVLDETGSGTAIIGHYYQVTARGIGGDNQTESFLRSIYVKFGSE